jgi:hypothetical protein
MPVFSVIIPTFNRVDLLKAALESVFSQRCSDLEIIVVDDGSTDGTWSCLKSLDGRVKYFRQPNRGPGGARNLGARHAIGEYLTFLDSDDLWFPWTLEVYRDAIHEHSNPAFLAGKPRVFSIHDELDKVVSAAVQTERFADYLASADQWRWYSASSFIIRRDAFVGVGGFTEEFVNAEDADLALRLGVIPGFVQITHPVTFGYRDHMGGVMKDMNRTFAGTWSMVCAEQDEHYPGGKLRAMERRRILTRHTRPVTISCIRQGLRREAWMLYRDTFVWNAQQGRGKYLIGFPALAAVSHLRYRDTSRPNG